MFRTTWCVQKILSGICRFVKQMSVCTSPLLFIYNYYINKQCLLFGLLCTSNFQRLKLSLRHLLNWISHLTSQSLHRGGRWGTIDDVATIPFHLSLSSAALRETPNPIPVHSLMVSSHLLFCRPLLLAPFTVPCRIVFAMPEDLEMWPYHLSFRFLTMVRRSPCTPNAFWILLRTSSFVKWSL